MKGEKAMAKSISLQADFEKALEKGRPPNIKKLFPNSRTLIVSGKVIKIVGEWYGKVKVTTKGSKETIEETIIEVEEGTRKEGIEKGTVRTIVGMLLSTIVRCTIHWLNYTRI